MFLHRRKDLSENDLAEIWHNLNHSMWDARLGCEPEDYRNKQVAYFQHYASQIEKLIGEYKIHKHEICQNQRRQCMTDEEFDSWWDRWLLRDEDFTALMNAERKRKRSGPPTWLSITISLTAIALSVAILLLKAGQG